MVTENGQPLPFVNIMVKNTEIGTASDENGHFTLIELPTGKHLVMASSLGYVYFSKSITLSEG
ncbi:MAG: hypothetical protein DSY83_11785, partial [Flavobacteriia bacterium]